MSEEIRIKHIIKTGIDLLVKKGRTNTQAKICTRLKAIGRPVSPATLSFAKNDESRVGFQTLEMIADGLQIIIEDELNTTFSSLTNNFVGYNHDSWQAPIPYSPKSLLSDNNVMMQRGRLDSTEKIALYHTAKKEVIELGIRLRTFSNYFIDESPAKFRTPILEKLNKGVHIHCYILKPRGKFATVYFQDREKVQKGEEMAGNEMTSIMDKLVQIFLQLNRESKDGKMHLHTYDGFPYFHATAIDGKKANGKIAITQYLYGISRADSPRFQLNSQEHLEVYAAYWDSIKAVKQQSEEINLVEFSKVKQFNR